MESAQQNEERKAKKNVWINCKNNYKKLLGLIGAIMIFFPERLPNVWGNMTVYVTSYYYIRHGDTSAASTWTLAAFTIGSGVGINVVGFLAYLGRKKVVFVSVLLFNIGVVSMFFVFTEGLVIVLFVAFGMMGFCSGIFAAVIFKLLAEISGSSKGRYMSIACSGFNFGSVFVNAFVGFYMNPDNVSPSLTVDGMALFARTDLDLVDKVPSLVIILGVSYFLCMMTGCCLLFLSVLPSPKPATDKCVVKYGALSSNKVEGENRCVVFQESQENSTETETKANGLSSGYPPSQNVLSEDKTITISDPLLVSEEIKTNGCIESPGSETESDSDADSNNNNNSDGDDNNHKNDNDFTVGQILKYIPFYAMFFSMGSGLFPSLLLNASYKTFGLVHVKDDHLLTVLGSGHPLVGGVSRVVWGFVLDRFPIKTCLVIVYSYLSFVIMLMYFSPAVSENLYFLVTLLVSCGTSIILPTFLLVVVVYFGEKHFYKIYAMLKISRVLFALIVSPIFDGLQERFGWFGPFCCCSFVTMTSLILIVTVVPDVRRRPNK